MRGIVWELNCQRLPRAAYFLCITCVLTLPEKQTSRFLTLFKECFFIMCRDTRQRTQTIAIDEDNMGIRSLFSGERRKSTARPNEARPSVKRQPYIAETVQIAPNKDGLEGTGEILLPADAPFGLRLGDTDVYTPVPATLMSDSAARHTTWRIELHGLAPGAAPIGFDILGDVILGRNTAGTHEADIDFQSYNGGRLGVSRRHAMLRPSAHKLFLMDLDSTNGISHNAVSLPASSVRALGDGDIVSLGKLTFQVKLIDGPFRSQSEPVTTGKVQAQ
jgi:hypothetical protein